MTGVVSSENETRIVTIGIQGPQGAQGPPGNAGGVFVQETAPVSPQNGDYWLKLSIPELSIYVNAVWEPIPLKSDLADELGSLMITGGFF